MTGKNFLVTGSTGFLGGYITAGLISRGHRVTALARASDGMSAEQRLKNLTRFFDLDPADRLEVYSADVEKGDLGLDPRLAHELRSRTDHLIHCAAETSFAARRSERVLSVNVTGLENVFNILGGGSHFHHMSTVYAAGKAVGVCREELIDPPGYNNVYERSKNIAEKLISGLCAKSGCRLSIYRPSIVYGEHGTGRSIRFTALYHPVRMLLFLRDTLRRDILDNGGSRASQLGASILPDGRTFMPITLPHTGGGMNLIPVDHLSDSVTEIIESGEDGIFHIVNRDSVTLDELVEYVSGTFGIHGLTIVNGERGHDPGPLEMLMDSYIDVFYPYIRDTRRFDDTRASEILDRAGLYCPRLDSGAFRRCMNYAVDCDWGAGIGI